MKKYAHPRKTKPSATRTAKSIVSLLFPPEIGETADWECSACDRPLRPNAMGGFLTPLSSDARRLYPFCGPCATRHRTDPLFNRATSRKVAEKAAFDRYFDALAQELGVSSELLEVAVRTAKGHPHAHEVWREYAESHLDLAAGTIASAQDRIAPQGQPK